MLNKVKLVRAFLKVLQAKAKSERKNGYVL